MIRNLKVLGLALGALFAMSAMMASAASAHTPATFTTEGTTITAEPVTGDEANKFTVTGQEVNCQIIKFTAEKGTTTVKAAVHYENCSAPPLGATITGFATTTAEIGQKGKCWYDLSASGTAALECNEGDVTVDAGPCIVHIPAQHFEKGVTYATNVGGGLHDLTIKFHIEKITATHTDGFLCPFGSSGHSAEGTLEGQVTAYGETGETKFDLTWDATVA